MSVPPKSPRRLQDLCAILVFLALLVAPAVAFALRHDSDGDKLAENRKAEEFPARPRNALDWAAWPRAFEAWHDDHFGLRSALLRAHALLFVFVLESDPSPRLMIGRERWIYNPISGIDFWRGARPFSASELEAWRSSLEGRRREFAERGIDYFFVPVPSKAEIYPEFLPARFKKGGPSRLDQLAAQLAPAPAGVVLDLRPALLDEKTRDGVDDFAFYPLGVHWNERGALAGTRAIVQALAATRPAVGAVDDTVASWKLADEPGDTLALQMDLADLVTQRVREAVFSASAKRELAVERIAEPRTVVVDQDDASLPRAVIFHDSFGMPLPSLLGRHFSHSVFVWQPEVDLALVEREKPDVVLQILSDRMLTLPPPRVLDAAGEARTRDRFQASSEVAIVLDVATNTPRVRCAAGGRVSVRGSGAEARVACTSQATTDTFLLPEFSVRRGAHPIVRLAFESSVASSASLFFQTRTDASYTRRRQVQSETHIGMNELYLEILEPELAGRLMFRPAQEIGTFLISALEVRLVPD